MASIKGIFPINTVSLKGQYHPPHRGHLIPAGDCCLKAIDPSASAQLPASVGAQMNVFSNHFQEVTSAALGPGAKQVAGREIGEWLWRMRGNNVLLMGKHQPCDISRSSMNSLKDLRKAFLKAQR